MKGTRGKDDRLGKEVAGYLSRQTDKQRRYALEIFITRQTLTNKFLKRRNTFFPDFSSYYHSMTRGYNLLKLIRVRQLHSQLSLVKNFQINFSELNPCTEKNYFLGRFR